MTPFYFGTSTRRLFGLYQAAAATGKTRPAVVLCHPWESEYLHAHRTMYHLASRLAAAGFHSLRFDYFGTGDSGGEMAECTLSGAQADLDAAVDEVRNLTGAHDIILIGLRLGGSIVLQRAARLPHGIDAIVLWEPVTSGTAYLRSLGASLANTPAGAADNLEARGFTISPVMVAELAALDLADLLAAPPVRTLMLLTRDQEPAASDLSMAAMPGAPALAIQIVGPVRPWVEKEQQSGGSYAKAMDSIVNWLS
jgi:pimeloyl-ACP methyl ester carboxylesterase